MKKTVTLTLLIAFSTAAVQAQLFDNIGTDTPAKDERIEQGRQNVNNEHTAAELINYMQQSKEIEADFTQITYNQRGEEISSGHMWIAKPNKFFWDYHSPYEQQIISDGKNVYHYDKDLEQITVRSQDELVGDVAIRLLEGQESLNDEFEIQALSVDNVPAFIEVNTSNSVVYSLEPTLDNAEYNAVWVVLQDNELAQVIVDGGTGQQTIMSFTNLKRNHGINASKFNFNPPTGVDVVGNIEP